MLTYHDPDIGLCDDCGSEKGTRVRRTRTVNMTETEQARIVVWLCAECR